MGPVLFHFAHCLTASALAVQPSVSRDLTVACTRQCAKDRKREEGGGRREEGERKEEVTVI